MRQPREPGVFVFPISGRIDRAEIPALCERLHALLESSTCDTVICDVGRLGQAAVTTVDALARLQLTARRSGRRLRVGNASRELVDLLALVGLSNVVPIESTLAIEAGGTAAPR